LKNFRKEEYHAFNKSHGTILWASKGEGRGALAPLWALKNSAKKVYYYDVTILGFVTFLFLSVPK